MAWIKLGSNPVANAVGVTIVIILLIVFIWYFHKKTPVEESISQPQNSELTRLFTSFFMMFKRYWLWL